MARLGFIGAGNMGQALMKGMLEKGAISKGEVTVYDKLPGHIERLAAEYGVQGAHSAPAAVEACDMVILAVKPNVMADVLKECAYALRGKSVLSIVTGWSRADMEALAPGCRMLRCMPNTPCLVGEGMLVLDLDHTFTAEEYAYARRILACVGEVTQVQSALMDAVTGLSGSGPAYAYMFIEALADAGVREGLARDTAYTLAAQTVRGAASMVLHTKAHPGALKDAVCSPGGTTIEAVRALERNGFRAAVMSAVEASTEKARLLSGD